MILKEFQTEASKSQILLSSFMGYILMGMFSTKRICNRFSKKKGYATCPSFSFYLILSNDGCTKILHIKQENNLHSFGCY
jgi:fucose permease